MAICELSLLVDNWPLSIFMLQIYGGHVPEWIAGEQGTLWHRLLNALILPFLHRIITLVCHAEVHYLSIAEGVGIRVGLQMIMLRYHGLRTMERDVGIVCLRLQSGDWLEEGALKSSVSG